jgi:undecaprenyl-diphosphatase
VQARAITRVLDTLALVGLRPEHHGTAGAASALSGVVRGGAGWIASSAVLSTAGPQYRRAAVDGLAGWGLAEVSAAGIKKVVGRRRPSLLTPLGGAPSSSSMPSAHTAAGVAYAVAAGASAPLVAAPLLALAGGVAWSRLSTGRHFPTDVAAAAAVGIVAGGAVVLTRHLHERDHVDAPTPA